MEVPGFFSADLWPFSGCKPDNLGVFTVEVAGFARFPG